MFETVVRHGFGCTEAMIKYIIRMNDLGLLEHVITSHNVNVLSKAEHFKPTLKEANDILIRHRED
jgi:hypothetical protein